MAPHAEDWREAVPLEWKVNPARNLEKHQLTDLEDSQSPVILLMGGINSAALGEVLTGCLMLRYNIREDSWKRCTMMPLPRYAHRATLVNRDLIITGGFDNRDATYGLRVSTSCCFKMDVKTSDWTLLPPMKHSRAHHGAATLNNQLYVIGGVDSNDLLLPSVEVFDPTTKAWQELKEGLYSGRMGMGVTVFDGCIWVVGGVIQFSGLQTCSTAYVEIYNPQTAQWTYTASLLPSPRTSVALLSNADSLYCFGGMFYNSANQHRKLMSINDVICYSGKKHSWNAATSLPTGRHNAQVAKYEDTGYIIGGQDVKTPEKNVRSMYEMVFSGNSIKYKELKEVPLAISLYSVVVLPPGDKAR